jgi:hypothetical protein
MNPEDKSKEKTLHGKEFAEDNGAKKMAVNPNPRANENLPEKKSIEKTSEAGSEITDGEGG